MIFSKNIHGSSEKLKEFRVGIAGCGGLGSNIAVSLVRTGIVELILVDFDKVEESNLNRQHFFQDDIGKLKVEALKKHLERINPDIFVSTINKKLNSDDISTVFEKVDILFEAFDDANSKLWLIESWATAFPEKPIICGSGISGLGEFNDIRLRKAGNIYICGDEKSDMSLGLMAPKVAIVANLQAMTGIEVLLNK